MSAVEVLKEMRSLFNESNSWEVTQERDNALYQALLALEQIDDIKLDLKLIIQNINEDNYINLKQDVLDDLKEVLGVIQNEWFWIFWVVGWSYY